MEACYYGPNFPRRNFRGPNCNGSNCSEVNCQDRLSGLSLAAGGIVFRQQVLMQYASFSIHFDAQQFSVRKRF